MSRQLLLKLAQLGSVSTLALTLLALSPLSLAAPDDSDSGISLSADASSDDIETLEQLSQKAPPPPFDFSTPVDYERCKRTAELNAYIDSLPRDDLPDLAKLKVFLVSCQALIHEHIETHKQEINDLRSSDYEHPSKLIPQANSPK